LGIWSSVDAVYTFFDPSALRSIPAYRLPARVCTLGLPRYMATASRPYRSMIGVSPASTASNASSHVAGTSLPSRRTRGVRSRSGSLSSSPKEAPFGQMKPWLSTSSASPRTLTIRSSASVTSRPQVASHRGHVV
jgi:hypothetical protein